MDDFVTREKWQAMEAAVLQLQGNRAALVIAIKALIQHCPHPEAMLNDLFSALNPQKIPDMWPQPYREGFQGTSQQILQDAAAAGVLAQAAEATKN